MLFKSYKGDEEIEKEMLDYLYIEAAELNDSTSDNFYTLFKEHVKRFMYNEYALEEDQSYICYICKEESKQGICADCSIKQDWVDEATRTNVKVMGEFAKEKNRMNRELDECLTYYFPEFLEKENKFLSKKMQLPGADNKKGDKFERFVKEKVAKSKKAKFLDGINVPEKVIIEKYTMGDKFGDEVIDFFEENKLTIGLAKIAAFIVFTAAFIGMVYFFG